jgi:predicted extracellular nuclease
MLGIWCRGRISALVAALALAGSAGAQAEVWISEYVNGSANNKALELYNPGPTAVDLNLGGYSLQVFLNGSATASRSINLTGLIAPGGTFVIAHTSAVLPGVKVNQASSSLQYNGNVAIVLRHNTTVIDSVGQVGRDPGTGLSSGVSSMADKTLCRKITVCVGDAVTNDAFTPATQWDGFAMDTFGGLGSHTASCTGSENRQIQGSSDASSLPVTDDMVALTGTVAELSRLTELTSAPATPLSSGALPASGMPNETITYGYDARGRLVKVEHAGSVNNNLQAIYTYDKAGNRATLNVTGSPN